MIILNGEHLEYVMIKVSIMRYTEMVGTESFLNMRQMNFGQ